MTRETWTDERMDDLSRRVDTGFAQVDRRFEQVHDDISALRLETKALVSEIRQEKSGLGAELRAEMKTLGSELRSEMKALGSDLRSEMEALGTELRSDTKALRAELQSESGSLRSEMHLLRSEMNEQFLALNHRFDMLMTTLIAAILTAILGLIASQVF